MASPQGMKYVSAGRDAVTYVKSKVKFGAANNPFKLQSSVEGQLRAMGALLRTRGGEDQTMDAKFVNPADTLRVAQAFAENAERYGGGNCGEQSAVAYVFLRRRAVFPIDWVRFMDKDHAFVIIGRSSDGSSARKNIPEQPWFPDAVICDAYWNRCEFWSGAIGDYDPTRLASLLHQESQGLQQWKNL
jgi:hypothetical protein